jgi:hypothetical protein
MLTSHQRHILEHVLNAFETGSAEGDYSALSVHRDGPHGIRQLTYGRSQTKEYGKLRLLVERYVAAKGMYSAEMAEYAGDAVWTPVTDDCAFRSLLEKAGRYDPVMHRIQDDLFEAQFFDPAMQWSETRGLTFPLSLMVVYDTFVQSGSVSREILSTVRERVPSRGGDERTWTALYVEARHRWFTCNDRKRLRRTGYRMRCFAFEIARHNWYLDRLPIRANGVKVDR